MKNIKSSFMIAVLTFLLAILVTLSSQSRVQHLSFFPALLVLIIIILVGIMADMIGVAVTAADPSSFNARAAKKVFGAKTSLFLVTHADRVASLMCDIIGDICGTVSGAIGIVIGMKIVENWGGSQSIINLVTLGLISSLTVGGKAFFKSYGIKNADKIIFSVGKVLAVFKLFGTGISSRLRGEY